MTGLLVTVALAVELLSLGLATSAVVGKGSGSRIRSIFTTSMLALLPLTGAVVGAWRLIGLSGG